MASVFTQGDDVRESHGKSLQAVRVGYAYFQGADRRRDDVAADLDHREPSAIRVVDQTVKPLVCVNPPWLVRR